MPSTCGQLRFLLHHICELGTGARQRGSCLGEFLDPTSARFAQRLQVIDSFVPDVHTLVQAVLVLLVSGEQWLERVEPRAQPLDLRGRIGELLLRLTPCWTQSSLYPDTVGCCDRVHVVPKKLPRMLTSVPKQAHDDALFAVVRCSVVISRIAITAVGPWSNRASNGTRVDISARSVRRNPPLKDTHRQSVAGRTKAVAKKCSFTEAISTWIPSSHPARSRTTRFTVGREPERHRSRGFPLATMP